MIKVLVGYKLKEGANIDSTLVKFRSHAMQYKGFIGAENLCNAKDNSVVAMVTTWERLEDWSAWEKSKVREQLLQKVSTLLKEEPRVTIYEIIPTVRWVG